MPAFSGLTAAQVAGIPPLEDRAGSVLRGAPLMNRLVGQGRICTAEVMLAQLERPFEPGALPVSGLGHWRRSVGLHVLRKPQLLLLSSEHLPASSGGRLEPIASF